MSRSRFSRETIISQKVRQFINKGDKLMVQHLEDEFFVCGNGHFVLRLPKNEYYTRQALPPFVFIMPIGESLMIHEGIDVSKGPDLKAKWEEILSAEMVPLVKTGFFTKKMRTEYSFLMNQEEKLLTAVQSDYLAMFRANAFATSGQNAPVFVGESSGDKAEYFGLILPIRLGECGEYGPEETFWRLFGLLPAEGEKKAG